MLRENAKRDATPENHSLEGTESTGFSMSPQPFQLQASGSGELKKPEHKNVDFQSIAITLNGVLRKGYQFNEADFMLLRLNIGSLGENGWNVTALKTEYQRLFGTTLESDVSEFRRMQFIMDRFLDLWLEELDLSFDPKDTSKHKPSVIATNESKLDTFFNQYQEITVLHNDKSVSTKAPYHWNMSGDNRVTNAKNNREANREVTTLLADLKNEGKINGNTFTGKATPKQLASILTAALSKGLVNHTRVDMFDFLAKYGLGIDCSGFVSMAYNFMRDGNMDATDEDKFKIQGTGSGSFKGGTGSFTKVEIKDVMAGDTMHLSGHIRIINRVKNVDEVIYFQTIESTGAQNPNNQHDGVHRRWWKHEGGKTHYTWDNPNTDSPETATMKWKQDNDTNTYGRPK